MAIAVKSAGMRFPKIVDTAGPEDADTEDHRRLVTFLKGDPGVELYRVIEQGNGNYRLNKLRIKPGTEVTGTVIIDAEFEDVNPSGN